MQINMYAVRVRLVQDARGIPLEAKPKRVVIALARNHDEALDAARLRFTDMEQLGVEVEYQPAQHLGDVVALEAMVFA